MTIQGLSGSVSALKAFGTKMASTADNIANSQSKKFKKTRVVLSEQQGGTGGVKAEVSKVNTPGYVDSDNEELSNVDMAEEISSMIPTSRNFEANVKTVQTMDEMTGTIINIVE